GAHWSQSYFDANHPAWTAIVVDPANSSNVWAGAFTTVVKSPDAGAHWNDDSAGLSIAGQLGDAVDLIPGLAVTSNIVYAATYHGGLVSQTGGSTWTNVPNTPSNAQYTNCVAVDGSTIFVGYDGGLFKGSGTTWAQLTAGSPNFFVPTTVGALA